MAPAEAVTVTVPPDETIVAVPPALIELEPDEDAPPKGPPELDEGPLEPVEGFWLLEDPRPPEVDEEPPEAPEVDEEPPEEGLLAVPPPCTAGPTGGARTFSVSVQAIGHDELRNGRLA